METALSKEPLFLALADILHKNNLYSRTWGGLNIVFSKLELARSKSNEILTINVLQKFSNHVLYGIHVFLKQK